MDSLDISRSLPEPVTILTTTAKASYRKIDGLWKVTDEGCPDGFLTVASSKEAKSYARTANRGGGFFGFTPQFMKRSAAITVEDDAPDV